MTNDMSLPPRLFYMLIVPNASNTNLHCVYFTEHQFTTTFLKTPAKVNSSLLRIDKNQMYINVIESSIW